MKIILSLTSIPSRFHNLNYILHDLSRQNCNEIWLNIPKKYNRFPDWDGVIPKFNNPKVFVNVIDKDYGPGTKFIGPALKLDPDDLIIYVDDDTKYNHTMVDQFVKQIKRESCAWGLSGFKFKDYFNNSIVRKHDEKVDILEGYGGVIVKAGWVQTALPEFEKLLIITCHDDILLCNLLHKQGVDVKTIYKPEFNISHVSQYSFGFENDALHNYFGGHVENNKKIIKELELRGFNYFDYK